MNRALLAVAAFVGLLAAAQPAAAQSGCSTIVYGAVLTAAQWNACFQAKQDSLFLTGTSGGVVYFSSPTTLAGGPTLGANQIVLGGGTGQPPTSLGGTGTAAQVLHGNASGAPTFGAVNAATDITGILPAANGGAGAVNGILKANGSGLVTATTIGAGLAFDGTTLSATGAGSVTSVGQTFTGGLISVSGSPVTSTGTLALTVAGTSGGIPYFSGASTWASSAALAANALVIGGGAGVAPSTTTTGSGVLTFLGTPSSANLAAAVTDETGSGALVFSTSPTFVTPVLGTPASGNAVNMTGYTVGNLAGLGAGVGTFLATPSSTNLAAALTDETGTGSSVFANGPTLIAPVLGTPASGDASNLINIPVANATGILPAANGGAGAITGILYANGSGLNSALTVGSGLSLVGSTLSATGSGVTITPTSGNVANDLVCMQNTTTVIQDCGFSSTAIPTSKLATTLNAQTGAYTIATTDAGKINYLNSASPFTFTVPTGATLGAGFATDISNANTGLLTSTLASGTWADTGNASITTVQGQELFTWVGAANNVHSWLSMPPIAQDSILGNASTFDYPKAMALPSTCANDGAHAAIYTSHAWACAAITGGVASSVAVGTTTITGGTSGRVEYNNAGVLGEMTTTGSGTVLALATSPAFTTPSLGSATATGLNMSGTSGSVLNMGSAGLIQANGTTKISFASGNVNISSGAGSVIVTGAFAAFGSNGAGIGTATPTCTSPSLQPNWAASGTTGIGSCSTTTLAMISGGTDIMQFASTGPVAVTIPTDATHTDATLCRDTTSGAMYTGTGTLGICLGTSTERAKENISSIINTDDILKLRPVSFNYREGWGYPTDKPYYGFLAEEVEKVLPRLVGHNEKGQVLNADYVGMIPLMVGELQKQAKEIERLKRKK